MNFGVERRIALLRSARAKAFDHGWVKRHIGAAEHIVDVVPALQARERIQTREQKLIVLQRALNRNSGEHQLRLLMRIQPSRKIDSFFAASILPALNFFAINFRPIVRVKLKEEIGGEQIVLESFWR